jgi:hypothetical protein
MYGGELRGSRHDWLEGRGPRLTLVGGIDDATGRLTGATFCDQGDTAGYLVVLRDTVRRHGIPIAVYRDRHGLFETPRGSLMTLEEQHADTRAPSRTPTTPGATRRSPAGTSRHSSKESRSR